MSNLLSSLWQFATALLQPRSDRTADIFQRLIDAMNNTDMSDITADYTFEPGQIAEARVELASNWLPEIVSNVALPQSQQDILVWVEVLADEPTIPMGCWCIGRLALYNGASTEVMDTLRSAPIDQLVRLGLLPVAWLQERLASVVTV